MRCPRVHSAATAIVPSTLQSVLASAAESSAAALESSAATPESETAAPASSALAASNVVRSMQLLQLESSRLCAASHVETPSATIQHATLNAASHAAFPATQLPAAAHYSSYYDAA